MNVPLNIDWQQILLHLLNFVILFAILYFLLYDPVKRFMNKRRDYYKQLDDQARANFADSERAKKEYMEKMQAAEAEIEQKKQTAHKLLSEETAKTMLSAKQAAAGIISDARMKAESEHDQILEKAQSAVAGMVAAATGKIVLQASTAESYEQFLTAVERGGEDEQ